MLLFPNTLMNSLSLIHIAIHNNLYSNNSCTIQCLAYIQTVRGTQGTNNRSGISEKQCLGYNPKERTYRVNINGNTYSDYISF